jgi:GGDEF domain-containing protein
LNDEIFRDEEFIDNQKENYRQLLEIENKNLERNAMKDPLTDLYNRRSFDINFAQIKEQAERFGEQFSIIFVDLDHFKQVNDNFGHSV